MTSPSERVDLLSPSTTNDRIGARVWWAIIVVGLVGQIAWMVENMYLNVFMYERITHDPNAIALMVALSAIAATVATIIVGAWSDRTGRRRSFVTVGYVLWGASTAAFGLLSPPSGAVAAPFVAAAVFGIIALDCIMSMIGSGANSAAFGAWVTDVTTPRTRGLVDAVLAVMPLLAMLLVFAVLDGLTRAGDWRLFFCIVGGVTIVSGIVGGGLMREVRVTPSAEDEESVWRRMLFGFRPSTMRAHRGLYATLMVLLIIGVASQVFLPYVIIYLQYGLQVDSYALVLGVSLIAASLISVLGGVLMNRIGKARMLLPATALFATGLVGMFFARESAWVIAAAAISLGGMMLAVAAASATSRDETPTGHAGMVQGLRMVTGIMVPMVIGPFLGAAVIVGSGQTYTDLGVSRPVPGPEIFLTAAVVLVLIPVLIFVRHRSERRQG